jgi:hypothetical protein
MTLRIAAALALTAALAGCAGDPPQPPQHHEEEWAPPSAILLRYADKDGRLTRAGLEAGLRKDFDAADSNHNGVLEPDEMRVVNEQRWEQDRSAVSPLVDWNGDGVIDFNEFAATARNLFPQYDVNHNGVLDPGELRPAGAPRAQGGTPEQDQPGESGGKPGGRHGGPQGGGSAGGNGSPGGGEDKQ